MPQSLFSHQSMLECYLLISSLVALIVIIIAMWSVIKLQPYVFIRIQSLSDQCRDVQLQLVDTCVMSSPVISYFNRNVSSNDNYCSSQQNNSALIQFDTLCNSTRYIKCRPTFPPPLFLFSSPSLPPSRSLSFFSSSLSISPCLSLL